MGYYARFHVGKDVCVCDVRAIFEKTSMGHVPVALSLDVFPSLRINPYCVRPPPTLAPRSSRNADGGTERDHPSCPSRRLQKGTTARDRSLGICGIARDKSGSLGMQP